MVNMRPASLTALLSLLITCAASLPVQSVEQPSAASATDSLVEAPSSAAPLAIQQPKVQNDAPQRFWRASPSRKCAKGVLECDKLGAIQCDQDYLYVATSMSCVQTCPTGFSPDGQS
ncbi:hypothetical protein ACM66B_001242 [Microbotryomycetes sp. NB124-2]